MQKLAYYYMGLYQKDSDFCVLTYGTRLFINKRYEYIKS